MARQKKLIFGILILALLVRIAVFFASGGMFLAGEGRVQADLATNFLQGRGFMLSPSMLMSSENARTHNALYNNTFEFYRRVDGFYGVLRPGQPTTFLVPGCAIFQAAVFSVFGAGNLVAVDAVQLFLGVLTVFFGLLLAARFLKGKYLLLAGITMALDPFELYYEAIPATQALFSLLFMASVVLSLRLFDYTDKRRVLWLAPVTGLVWAMAFYVRPAALLLVAWLGCVLVFSKRFSPRVLLSVLFLGAAFFLALVPWGLRNLDVTGKFRIMPTQGGVNLWEFNGRVFSSHFRDELSGTMILFGGIREEYMGRLNSPELAEFPDFTDEPEWVRDSILYDRTYEFLRRNPVLIPELSAIRFVNFFKPFPLNRFSIYHTLLGLATFFWVLLFMVPGSLRLLARGGAGVFLAGSIWGYVLMHVLTASGTPHRVAIDFPLIVAACLGLRTAVLRHRYGKGLVAS